MPTQMFKIYDGRKYFWQWDTNQKLIVLDDSVAEIQFSNKHMPNAIVKRVYEEDGLRVCNVPKVILQSSENVIAYAASNYATLDSIQFAVKKRPIPNDYVTDNEEDVDAVTQRLDMLEATLKDLEENGQELFKFESIDEAAAWAKKARTTGIIVAVHVGDQWVAHMVEEDYRITPICETPDYTFITILASAWRGTSSPYYQTVECDGVNANSKVDLQPSPAQIAQLQEYESSLMAVNNNGVVTIYAIGEKPTSTMSIQVLITEVEPV